MLLSIIQLFLKKNKIYPFCYEYKKKVCIFQGAATKNATVTDSLYIFDACYIYR